MAPHGALAPVLVLLLALVAAPQAAQAQQASVPNNATDGELLQVFKATFSNGKDKLASWNGTDPCANVDNFGLSSWLGIICDSTSGRVTLVQLGDVGLQGTIPPGGYVLPEKLIVFNMWANQIRGTIPKSWKLPPGLLVISMFDNQISGCIPPEWVLPSTLTVLYLNGNKLGCSIPRDWVLPPKLGQLLLYSNELTGEIPWSTWTLPLSLTELDLHDNQLSGTLPAGDLLPGNLTKLVLEKNKVSGTIPAAWQLPAGLTELRIGDNQLSGTLPPDILFPEGLVELDIQSGNLGGSIPDQWVLPASLEKLQLYENFLTGTLPTWADLPNTTVTILPGNTDLCGEVPDTPYYINLETKESVADLPSCGSGSSTGAIVGGVVGGVAALVLILLAVWLIIHKRARAPLDIEKAETVVDVKAMSMLDKSSGDIPDDPLLKAISSRLAMSSTGTFTASSATTAAANRSKGSARALGVDVSQYLIDFRELTFTKQVGSGSFGRVYLAQWKETMVAAKLLLGEAATKGSVTEAVDIVMSQLDERTVADLQKEAELMAAMRHPNILGFMALSLTPPCLISEYCPRGSLYAVLKDANASPALAQQLSWVVRLRIATGAAAGMHYLHSFKPSPVLHRDLKSPNLLITADWNVKVCDFNLSKLMGITSSACASTAAVTNPRWLAPEVLLGNAHTFASDVFSFGIVLWEMLVWKLPWGIGDSNPWQVVNAVTAGKRPEIPPPDQLPGRGGEFEGRGAYIALIQRCWAHDPAERPAFQEIVTELRELLALAAKSKKDKKGAQAGSQSANSMGSGASTQQATRESGHLQSDPMPESSEAAAPSQPSGIAETSNKTAGGQAEPSPPPNEPSQSQAGKGQNLKRFVFDHADVMSPFAHKKPLAGS